MRLSPERIKELQKLLKEQLDLDYTDEQAQEAGLAIMRFVAAKELRNKETGIEAAKPIADKGNRTSNRVNKGLVDSI